MFPRYISGANVEQEKVDMTIPVLTRMKMLENRMVNKEMCFYLNKAHQANPPSPTNPEVKIVRNQELTVFVHTFGGYANKDSVNLKEGRRFAEVPRKCTCQNCFMYLSKSFQLSFKVVTCICQRC